MSNGKTSPIPCEDSLIKRMNITILRQMACPTGGTGCG
jgi:hypothetical protein